MSLSPAEAERYARQMRLPEVGPAGQERLAASSVLVVGAGGLGSPVALYLAAAGVGRIGLVDFDVVDESNLHRQILYTTADVARPKLEVAVERLRALNPHVEVEPHATKLTADNARALVEAYDVVADGTDTFATRYAVNDACVATGRPNAFASVQGFQGQASVFGAPGGPCYRCLFPEPPPPGAVPSCAEGGVLGVLPGLMGSIQATEVLKLLLGVGDPLIGRLLLVDGAGMTFRSVHVDRDLDCICNNGALVVSPHRSAPAIPEIAPVDAARWLSAPDPPLLLDVRSEEEHAADSLGGTLLPLSQLPWRLDELEASRPVLVHCRSGARSAQAVAYLNERGFRAVNVRGGIEAWRRDVEAQERGD